jgi:hypothetical protein
VNLTVLLRPLQEMVHASGATFVHIDKNNQINPFSNYENYELPSWRHD